MKPEWYHKLPMQLIETVAHQFGLDPLLVAAICQHESLGVRWKTRSEVRPQQEKYLQDYREHASRLGISQETEKFAQMHSYGLMQVMGWLARERGFRGYLTELCMNDVNLHYGCMHLRWLMEHKCREEADVISAYNQGSPRKANGMYLNQRYVDSVYRHLMELRKLA